MTCEPPPESRDVRWHWVQRSDHQPEIAEWQVWHDSGWWRTLDSRHHGMPGWLATFGYRYIAPIPMPETVP